MMAGYSGTPLIRKLGIKPGMTLLLIHAPAEYETTLGELPDDVRIERDVPPHLSQDWRYSFIQCFTTSREELANGFCALKAMLAPNGMLWISWPKRASKIETDLTENVVREIGLDNGLVDVKVAAIDWVWSGLKFVYRLEDRPQG